MTEENNFLLMRERDSELVIRISGTWQLQDGLPSMDGVKKEIERPPHARLVLFDTRELAGWDSSVVWFLTKVSELCREIGIPVDRGKLPKGLRRLVELAEAVPEKKGARREFVAMPFLKRVGQSAIGAIASFIETLNFLGQISFTFLKLVKVRFRAVDLFLFIQQNGPQALPIVTLISFLVGIILAFIGAVQLRRFGAQIYVADLVGIAIVREMGAMMTGIIMAGRTGAAFAAQLGTMKVTQEIDAFTTIGLPAEEFLVFPRVIALVLMMPLLCLYADFIGVLGGAVVGVGMLDISWTTYFRETTNAITLTHLFGGLLKSTVYGVLIALSGCLRGLQCGKSSSAVGDAATSAVVTGIVAIVVACGVFAVVFYVLGI
ncbi:MAG TPA: ABC transporter permease [Candidatus Binatia bacterium]|nr:ABC transporter permease [Candidatus Binatia bacterium]